MVWNLLFLRKKLLILLKKEDLVELQLTINYVTGYSQDRDIGVNLFQSYIVLTVEQFRFLKISCHYYYLT